MKDNIHKPYKPVSCDAIDWVEHYATLRKSVDIIYMKDDSQKTISSIIKTWIIKDSIEYLVLETVPDPIRMDYVLQIDDTKLNDLNSCTM